MAIGEQAATPVTALPTSGSGVQIPGHIINQTHHLGDFGGADADINLAAQVFVLHACLIDRSMFDAVMIMHDGVGPIDPAESSSSGGYGGAGENQVEFNLYRVLGPDNKPTDELPLKLTDSLIPANLIATQVSSSLDGPQQMEFALSDSNIQARRMNKGDRLVLTIASVADQVSSSSSGVAETTLAAVSATVVGRTYIG